MFLPSLLEYSTESLQQKLDLITIEITKFKQLTKTTGSDQISLHLDFVLPQFAKDRSVMKSLSPQSVFDTLETSFKDKQLSLSLHLMGDSEDLSEVYRFFESYNFNPKWEYLFFVPEKYSNLWQTAQFSQQKNIKTGIWLDLNEWQSNDLKASGDYLLMTVLAGKSGQKLTDEIKNKVLGLTKNHTEKNFILDGGWSVDNSDYPENVKVVSYSSFWKNFS